jgi:hypothetical protein
MRDPRGFLNSHRQYTDSKRTNAPGPLRRAAAFLRRLTRLEEDYEAFLRLGERFGRDRVLVVHYESLVDDTARTSRTILDFLGLPYDTIAMRPTKAGKPAVVPTATTAQGGTVYRSAVDKWRRELTWLQIALTDAAMHSFYARHPQPYRPVTPGWVRRLLRPPLRFLLRRLRPPGAAFQNR